MKHPIEKRLISEFVSMLDKPDRDIAETIIRQFLLWAQDKEFELLSVKEMVDNTETQLVCAEAYQLIGQLSDIIPDADKWLDNLSEGKLIHKRLLPVQLQDDLIPTAEAEKLAEALRECKAQCDEDLEALADRALSSYEANQ